MMAKTRPSPGIRPPSPRKRGEGQQSRSSRFVALLPACGEKVPAHMRSVPLLPACGEKVPEGRMRGVFAILLILIACSSAIAQVKESITVSVVEVPVTVVGRDGNPIRGLTAANFEVLDEGKKRAITSFDAIDFMSSGVAQAISPLNPAARRNFMLVFDLGFSSPRSIQRAQDAARAFVAKSVQARDRIAVATLDTERGFRLLTAFTTDRALIAQAIDDPKAFKSNDPLQVAGFTPFEHREFNPVVRAIDRDAAPD